MKVLVIPEDPTLDQYILKPIVERVFRDLERRAQVEVLQDPHLRGVSEALAQNTIETVVAENPMVDLFLLIVDRDCNRLGNSTKADAREQEHPDRLIACLAIEEIEVWMLALHRAELPAPWAEIRRECDPKEIFVDPFLAAQRWTGLVGRGRKRAMRDLGAGWAGLLRRCPEVAELKHRVEQWLAARSPA